MIQIKNRWNGFIIKEIDAESLRDCDLSGSNLRDCDLRGCDLRGSDLSGSDLSGSDLSGSNLSGSDLSGSDLSDCDLSGSNLRGSDLSGSDLRGSDLRGSDLSGCDLSGSNLRGSNLSDCKNEPLIIIGLRWVVQISGTGWMQIGCQKHSITEWSGFDDDHISEMSGYALDFWIANKTMLLALCDQWKHPEE